MSRRTAVVVLGLAVATCTSMQSQYNIRRTDLSCENANRHAFQSLRSLGFTEDRFQPATVGHEGVVRGTRTEIHTGNREVTRTGVVRIRCDPGEVFVTADEDQFLSQDLTFTRGFYLAFTGLVEHAGP